MKRIEVHRRADRLCPPPGGDGHEGRGGLDARVGVSVGKLTRCIVRDHLAVWPLLVFLVALVGCPAADRGEASLADLVGVWDVEFRLDSDRSNNVAEGQIELVMPLDFARLCPPDTSDCEQTIPGTHNVDFDVLLERDLPPEVAAGVDTDGAVVFMVGGCCDRGEIGTRGRLRGDQITGSWEETYLGPGATGTFVFSKRQ